MSRLLRCIWNSNGFHVPSGYGSQLAEIIPYFKEHTDVAVSSFYGIQGGAVNLDGIPVYPQIDGDPFGSQAIMLHSRDFQADVIFTNQDLWPLDPGVFQSVKNLIPWIPIDHYPVPPAILDRVKQCYRVACYSMSGVDQLAKQGVAATYIPMSVNTQVFKVMDKKAARAKWNIPQDAFVVGMVAANRDNPSRKSFQEVIDAFAEFLKTNPKALLYTHTVIDAGGGFPIRDYCKFLGIEAHLRYDDHYNVLYKYPKTRVAELMNTFDVLANPSTQEGFGLPIVEAQACSVPVITTNYSSMPELITKDTGWLVEPIQKRFTQLGSYVAVVPSRGVYEALQLAYKAKRNKMGKKARKNMVNNFDTKLVFNRYWLPYLKRLHDELVPKDSV